MESLPSRSRPEPRPGVSARPAEDTEPLPVLPGFREMAVRRMTEERQRLVADLVSRRQAAGLSQTEVAARMGTSQSAVARLESGTADVRASTLERYAAAIGGQISWQLHPDSPPAAVAGPAPGPFPAPSAGMGVAAQASPGMGASGRSPA